MRFSLVLASTGDQLMCRMMHGALYGAIAPIRGEGAAHCRKQCEVRHLRRTVVASARKVERKTESNMCSAPHLQRRTALTVIAISSAFHLTVCAGSAWAEPISDGAPPPESVRPSLPSPSEIVRTLSDQLFGSFSPGETAPGLADYAEVSPESASEPDADQKAAAEERRAAASAEELAALRLKFEGTILPKIKSQIAGLDEQTTKNEAILELRRELLVAQDDIATLVDLAKEGNSLGAHAEAQRLQRDFSDIRDFVKANGGELVP